MPVTSARKASRQTLVKLPFGADANGEPVSIFDAKNGLACGCTCPSCGSLLVAKQKVKEWHFAHHLSEACAAGYESALHLAVKKILEDEKQIRLPACSVFRYRDEATDNSDHRDSLLVDSYEYITEVGYLERMGNPFFLEYSRGELGYAQTPGVYIKFDKVVSEQKEGDIRPDLVATINGRRIYIEVAVTHFVDAEKLQKIRALTTPTIELVIPPSSGPIDWASLRQFVLEGLKGKHWLHNPKVEAMADESFAIRLKEFEQKEGALASKRAVYETRYKPTKYFCFTKGNGAHKIYVRLCPEFVSLLANSTYTATDSELKKIVQSIGARFHAEFNKKHDQYEIPRNEVAFYAIAKSVQAEGLKLASFKAPDLDDLIQRLAASSMTSPGAIPPPGNWEVILYDAAATASNWPDYMHLEANETDATISISISGAYVDYLHAAAQAAALTFGGGTGPLRYTPITPLVIKAKPGERLETLFLSLFGRFVRDNGLSVKRVMSHNDLVKAKIIAIVEGNLCSPIA
jgi:hypothetical protein